MQAIVTKYHGPRNVKGSRVSATCQAGRIYLEWDDASNASSNHRLAAKALASKLGWGGQWVSGGTPNGDTVWVCATDNHPDDFFWIATGV